jgi:hypothetical protein
MPSTWPWEGPDRVWSWPDDSDYKKTNHEPSIHEAPNCPLRQFLDTKKENKMRGTYEKHGDRLHHDHDNEDQAIGAGIICFIYIYIFMREQGFRSVYIYLSIDIYISIDKDRRRFAE